MSNITFYEKPGCINNIKQKSLLRSAGHTVTSKNILTHFWTPGELKKFLVGNDATQWFNLTAPIITSGALDYRVVTPLEALKLMAASPILIKRPLMVMEGKHIQGFDTVHIDKLIGLAPAPGASESDIRLRQENLTLCPRRETGPDCSSLQTKATTGE